MVDTYKTNKAKLRNRIVLSELSNVGIDGYYFAPIFQPSAQYYRSGLDLIDSSMSQIDKFRKSYADQSALLHADRVFNRELDQSIVRKEEQCRIEYKEFTGIDPYSENVNGIIDSAKNQFLKGLAHWGSDSPDADYRGYGHGYEKLCFDNPLVGWCIGKTHTLAIAMDSILIQWIPTNPNIKNHELSKYAINPLFKANGEDIFLNESAFSKLGSRDFQPILLVENGIQLNPGDIIFAIPNSAVDVEQLNDSLFAASLCHGEIYKSSERLVFFGARLFINRMYEAAKLQFRILLPQVQRERAVSDALAKRDREMLSTHMSMQEKYFEMVDGLRERESAREYVLMEQRAEIEAGLMKLQGKITQMNTQQDIEYIDLMLELLESKIK
jgi:hypothetical protein